jgi:hypothetical protein
VASQHTEPFADPVGASLANLSELLCACLDAASARTVVEVGAYRGELTKRLLEWSGRVGARVAAVDPEPASDLRELATRHPELELVEETSLEALYRREPADAVVIDGDHNYFTVTAELRLIAERASGGRMPLIALHDVGWPHARRDTYYAPDRIPPEQRQPLMEDVLLAPGEPGAASAGIPFRWAAEREGGPRNGVLTAVEDFLSETPGLNFALVPAFFGLGIVWPEDAPWAAAIRTVVEPWDRDPALARLESVRLTHIVQRYRLDRQRELLRSLLDSRAFAVAERISRLRQGGDPVFSREQIRRVLGD